MSNEDKYQEEIENRKRRRYIKWADASGNVTHWVAKPWDPALLGLDSDENTAGTNDAFTEELKPIAWWDPPADDGRGGFIELNTTGKPSVEGLIPLYQLTYSELQNRIDRANRQ